MDEWRHGETTSCLKGDCTESFAFRAARISRPNAFRRVHHPRSREDFFHALRLLGAEPSIRQLGINDSQHLVGHVHVSCSQETWNKVFGPPVDAEDYQDPQSNQPLHLWKHFCSDGPVTCIGHLFQQTSGVRWVVLMRVAIL